MPDTRGTILIRESTPLPPGVKFETELFSPGWNVVKKPDRSKLTRIIEHESWRFFFLAGGTKVTVLGRDRPGPMRRAVRRVLARQEGRKFNALEVTKVVSRRLLGIPFLTITAHARHVQEGMNLIPAKDFVLRLPAVPTGKVAAEHAVAVPNP